MKNIIILDDFILYSNEEQHEMYQKLTEDLTQSEIIIDDNGQEIIVYK